MAPLDRERLRGGDKGQIQDVLGLGGLIALCHGSEVGQEDVGHAFPTVGRKEISGGLDHQRGANGPANTHIRLAIGHRHRQKGRDTPEMGGGVGGNAADAVDAGAVA